MRARDFGHLRAVRNGSHPSPMRGEPLAVLVRGALDAAGITPAEAARLTGLSTQHISQILNRRQRYNRPPTIATMQKLAKLPGLSLTDVQRAVAESARIATAAEGESISPVRRSAHAMIEEFAEDELPRVLQVLLALKRDGR